MKKQTHKQKSKQKRKEQWAKPKHLRRRREQLPQAKQKTPLPKSRFSHMGEGVFHGSRNGYGFVTVEGDAARDIFIPAHKTGGALDGDTVKVRYLRRADDGTEGEVLEILAYNTKRIIGTLCRTDRMERRRIPTPYYVTPDNEKLGCVFPVRPRQGDTVGDKVELRFLRPKNGKPSVEITDNFGPAYTKDANYRSILAKHEITVDFDRAVLQDAAQAAKEPLSDAGRVRLDREIIFTIDGADAKDLDDAVSLTRLPNGKWKLGVHIADVSHYVKKGSPTEESAMARGTSVYFTDKVVPMLPPVLSNGACSLNAGEDKYALSAHLTLSAEGELLDCKLQKTVIRSRVRGVYSEVNDLFAKGKASAFYSKYREVYPTLCKMHEFYRILAARSRARGSLDLDAPEAKILLDAKGYPTEIVRRERGDGERLIEQFMLTANEGVASLMLAKKLPCVFRVHEAPAPEKLESLRAYVRSLGLDTTPLQKEEPTAKELSLLLAEASERGLSAAVSMTVLRTMAKAKYSEHHAPHYGLGITNYCHFTSPIRRLSDLATHRILTEVLLGDTPAVRYTAYAKRAASAASETELRAMQAEREIDAMYKALYLSERIGEVFPATVSSVTKFGIFATLDNTCEGLIPLLSLHGAASLDEERRILTVGSTVYRIGDRISVRVEDAELATGNVEFFLAKEKTAVAE